MRILHTSDLHLGRSFFGYDILDAQRAFAAHLVDTAASTGANLVVIAGDVYDRAIPAPAAVSALGDLLSGLRAAGVPVLATSGNHDSFLRLGFGSDLLNAAGVHLRTRLSDILRPVCFDADGHETVAARDTAVAVYGIPYLEPALVAHRFQVARTHAAVLGHALELVRAHRRSEFPDAGLVVAAHAFVAGARASESERAIDVGGVGVVPAGAFSGVDYAALGHLHRPQSVTASVRYSGSPLPYSFDEGAKELLVVDVRTVAQAQRDDGEAVAPPADPVSAVRVERLPLPEFLQVRTITGTLDEVLAQPDSTALIQARLTDEQRRPQALPRLKRAFPRLVKYSWTRLADVDATPRAGVASPRSDEEVFGDFIGEVTGSAPNPTQRRLFAEALVQANREDA